MMSLTHVLLGAVFVLALAGVSCAAPAGRALLKAGFAADPAAAGWQGAAPKGQEFVGRWAPAAGRARGRFLVVEKGYWQSPPVAVEPFEYYRLTFRSKAVCEGYLCAAFYDADGNELAADNYDSLPGSPRWRAHERYLRANADAREVRLRFVARRQPVAIDDVVVEKADRADAAAWADRVYATLPALRYRPPETRWALLPKTMRRLARGPRLRLVLLGDSIANDTSHSAFDVLLERAWPRCRVEVVNSVRGGTGCAYYRQAGRVRQYVLPFKPHLLVIAGISNGYDIESIRRVIRQVRAESDCEIMVMTGCIHPRVAGEIHFAERAEMSREAACKVIEAFPERIRAMAAEEKVELFDVRRAWDEYILGSPRPHAWFMRDVVHANLRGKLVVGRILLRYFQPREHAAK